MLPPPYLKIVIGVTTISIDPDFKVTVIACGASGRAHLGNGLSLIDPLTAGNQQGGVVRIVGFCAIVMGNNHQLAKSAIPAGKRDLASVGGLDRSSVRGRNIQPCMIAHAAENLPVACSGGYRAA